jgi:hypothetical protein
MVREPLPFTVEDISECRRRFARLQLGGEAFSLDVSLIEPSLTPLDQDSGGTVIRWLDCPVLNA